MYESISLHYQAAVMTIEINNVSPDGVLSSKLKTQLLSAPEMLPKNTFGFCTEVSVVTGVVE